MGRIKMKLLEFANILISYSTPSMLAIILRIPFPDFEDFVRDLVEINGGKLFAA